MLRRISNALVTTALAFILAVLGFFVLVACVLPVAAHIEAGLRGQFDVECRDMTEAALRSHIVRHLKQHDPSAEVASLELVGEPRYDQSDKTVDFLAVAFDTNRAQQTAMVGCFGNVEISVR
ncbi:hypothetical protein SADO_12283 [Salinisphaera dokdonensis CL-ES53]|uniref:Transmembrane protein n=1 Tax=Salinisphaera dokdonensis CL-ES53 TaxID=1304272 RepID=A0ABV2B317_9GAMM